MAKGLLKGLKVLDLSLWQPGHTATQLLADLGADVLKIEPPGGDRMREMPERFANFNGYKRSLVLDLKSDADRRRLHALVASAEVVVEGFRPGVAARLGASYADLSAINPAVVYCSITGFGQTGPLAHASGHEQNYQAYAGVFVRPDEGGAPVAAGALIGDQGSGLAAAFAILAAVICARRTGEGEHIDVSMADLLLSWAAMMGPIGRSPPNAATTVDMPAMGIYATADERYVTLGIFNEEHFWKLLCDHLGLAIYSGYDMAARSAHAAEIRAALQGVFATRTADELVSSLGPLGIAIAPILSRAEAMDHPHFLERGVIADGPEGERHIAHPIAYLRHPALKPGHPPALGQGGELGWGD